MARINNIISIQNKINQELKKSRYVKFAYNAANTKLIAAQNQLLKDFDNDKANQEILAGPTAQGSDFLSWGNLYSFIGFDIGSTPTQDLRDFIEEGIQMKENPTFTPSKTKFIYNFKINYPSMNEIYKETSMDKFATDYPNNKSFVELVQGAINNTVGNYIFHIFFKKGSRSTTGLQNKNADNTFNSFTDYPDYIIGLFREFEEKFKK